MKNWLKEREATFELSNQILIEKLSMGIDGIEWLVMQTNPTELKKESLEQWLKFIKMYKHHDANSVMKDALIMKDHKFYRKYKFNWWISVDDTITYLTLLKERNYDEYFDFIKSLK